MNEKPKDEEKPSGQEAIICKHCHCVFVVPLKLPVMMCPWCGTPNFS